MSFEIENVRCVRETDKAILVEAPDFDEPQWVPQSQVDDNSEVYKLGTVGTLVVSDWWAKKQGWM
jgi:hypothetical protein